MQRVEKYVIVQWQRVSGKVFVGVVGTNAVAANEHRAVLINGCSAH